MLRKALPVVLALGLFAAGCGGPSPETSADCSGTGSITVSEAGDFRSRVVQIVTTEGSGGTMPLNGADATIYFDAEDVDFDAIGVCAGGYEECLLPADYKNTVTAETNDQGILEYFVRLVVFPGSSYSGSFYQAFGSANSTCAVSFSASAPDPA